MTGRATSRDLKESPVIGTATSYDLKYSPVIGRASSRDFLRDYDSGVFSDEELESSGYSEDMTETYSEIDIGVGIHNNKGCKFCLDEKEKHLYS